MVKQNPTVGQDARRYGFTLVELLVVIAIIGVLVGLLLPAVQAAREAARRISCTNNMKNVALAVQNYHDTNNELPAGINYNSNFGREEYRTPSGTEQASPSKYVTNKNLNGKGWIVDVLPQLEQQSLYDALKPGFDGSGGNNNNFIAVASNGRGMGRRELRTFIDDQLPVLTCPSDPSAIVREDLWHWTNVPAASTSYKGVAGDTALGEVFGAGGLWSNSDWGSVPDCFETLGCNGLFWKMSYYEPYSFRNISDGLSNTYLIGEGVVEQDLHSMAYFSDGDWASCNQQLNFFLADPSQAKTVWYDTRGFRSLHPGGAQFAMVDTSVRFVNEGIDHQVYRAFSTKDGGEVVSSDF